MLGRERIREWFAFQIGPWGDFRRRQHLSRGLEEVGDEPCTCLQGGGGGRGRISAEGSRDPLVLKLGAEVGLYLECSRNTKKGTEARLE